MRQYDIYSRDDRRKREKYRQEGRIVMEEKKNILTYEGLRKYEEELHELKVVKRQEVAQKIKEAI